VDLMIKFRKIPTIFLILLILSASTIFIVSYQYYESQRLESPSARDNFNFILTIVGPLIFSIKYDSFTNKYVDTTHSPEINFNITLNWTEMDEIYQKMMEVEFFDYPKIKLYPGSTTRGGFYILEVTYNNTIKKITYSNLINNEPHIQDGILEIHNHIIDILRTKPEIKELYPIE